MSYLDKQNAIVNLQKRINYVHTENTCKQKSFQVMYQAILFTYISYDFWISMRFHAYFCMYFCKWKDLIFRDLSTYVSFLYDYWVYISMLIHFLQEKQLTHTFTYYRIYIVSLGLQITGICQSYKNTIFFTNMAESNMYLLPPMTVKVS